MEQLKKNLVPTLALLVLVLTTSVGASLAAKGWSDDAFKAAKSECGALIQAERSRNDETYARQTDFRALNERISSIQDDIREIKSILRETR